MLHYNRPHLGSHASGRLSTRARAHFALGGIRAEFWVNSFRFIRILFLLYTVSKLDDSSGALSAASVAKETLKDRVTQLDGKVDHLTEQV